MEFGQHPREEEKLKFGIGVSVLFWLGLERKNNKQKQTNFISKLTITNCAWLLLKGEFSWES